MASVQLTGGCADAVAAASGTRIIPAGIACCHDRAGICMPAKKSLPQRKRSYLARAFSMPVGYYETAGLCAGQKWFPTIAVPGEPRCFDTVQQEMFNAVDPPEIA